jgi:hypothetical protein
MSVVIKHTTVNVGINYIEQTHEAYGRVITGNTAPEDDEHVLPLHYSLMGEVEPDLVPLSIEYSFEEKTSYRYDWVVGVAEPLDTWDWHRAMEFRKERAISVQLLIDCGDSGFSFSEMSPKLLGLEPSQDSSSFIDRNAVPLRESADVAAALAQGIPVVPGILKVGSSFIRSGEKDKKNWWTYRFFDARRKCSVVEWNISHTVLKEYGPLLRGSIVLSFHGTSRSTDPASPITMLLHPRLGFDPHKPLSYVPPVEELDTDERRVELSIEPVKPDELNLAP